MTARARRSRRSRRRSTPRPVSPRRNWTTSVPRGWGGNALYLWSVIAQLAFPRCGLGWHTDRFRPAGRRTPRQPVPAQSTEETLDGLRKTTARAKGRGLVAGRACPLPWFLNLRGRSAEPGLGQQSVAPLRRESGSDLVVDHHDAPQGGWCPMVDGSRWTNRVPQRGARHPWKPRICGSVAATDDRVKSRAEALPCRSTGAGPKSGDINDHHRNPDP